MYSMKIRKRGIDIKRHTKSYLVGNSWVSRTKAVQLAKAGRIDGVRAYKRSGVSFIKSLPTHTRLYDLPEVIRL